MLWIVEAVNPYKHIRGQVGINPYTLFVYRNLGGPCAEIGIGKYHCQTLIAINLTFEHEYKHSFLLHKNYFLINLSDQKG